MTPKDCADILERELLPAYQHGSPAACAVAAAAEYLRCVVDHPEVRRPYQDLPIALDKTTKAV